MVYDYDASGDLMISDSIWLSLSCLLLLYEIFIIVRYLIPLRIKSPYILLFYMMLTILLVA